MAKQDDQIPPCPVCGNSASWYEVEQIYEPEWELLIYRECTNNICSARTSSFPHARSDLADLAWRRGEVWASQEGKSG